MTPKIAKIADVLSFLFFYTIFVKFSIDLERKKRSTRKTFISQEVFLEAIYAVLKKMPQIET